MDVIKKQTIIAVSGVKNSGKTTFIEHMVQELRIRGYQVAVIKHDGHEFSPDVPNTDTWKFRQAGAYGTAIFSEGQWLVYKQEYNMNEERLQKLFPEADVILLEGFKSSDYPKFEIVRSANSQKSVCDSKTLLAIITDTNLEINGVEKLGLTDWKRAVDIILKMGFPKKRKVSQD